MPDPGEQARWGEIERVLDRALDLPAAERAAFVAEACGSDRELRRRVEALLAADAAAADYLENPVASLPSLLAAPYRAGHCIGPYELVREIGRGGLGVVCLAEDRRLHRRVALKLLSASRIGDPDARARFHREAKAASGLDHANICTVYDVGQSDAGELYIAMALVEGMTVKEKIARGPLPLGEAIEIACQTAAGLAHAHERGVVHRDVKSANLLVTSAGEVQIVDFGLAKLVGSSTMTEVGSTLGTVAYMSPEQIQGDAVDHRVDVWALGVVLYEMIAGRLPFEGESDQAYVFAILNRDPEPLSAVRSGVPRQLEPILAKALAKNPEERYQHVDELAVDLRRAMAGQAIPVGSSSARSWRRWAGVASLVGAGVAVGAGLATLAPNRIESPGSAAPIHLSVALPADQELSRGGSRRVAISPDGSRLVYSARSGDAEQLWVRRFEQPEFSPIPGTVDARDPFFSPDGLWVGFFAREGLHKVSLQGGTPQRLADAPTATNRGAAWSDEGTIILPLGQSSGLFRVSDAGGTPEPLTTPNGEPGGHFFPQVLPDGDHVLFTVWGPGGWRTAVLSLTSLEWAEIAEGCAAARFVSGYLVCIEMAGAIPTGNVLAAPLSLEQNRLIGRLTPLSRPTGLTTLDMAVSGTGVLVYVVGSQADPPTRLVWVDQDGVASPVTAEPEPFFVPVLSPDQTRIAAARRVEAGRQELWLYDIVGETSARLSAVGTISNLPVWWPDGRRVLFNAVASPSGLYSLEGDTGGDASAVLTRRGHIISPGSFSPSGDLLAYSELHDRNLGDLWILSLTDGTDRPLLRTPANERGPAFSPDGRWIAYASDVSGRDEVYVLAYPNSGAPIQVSARGGREPVWARDGSELYYRSGDAMLAIPVSGTDRLTLGRPVELFAGRFATEYLARPHYDVSADGRFLMVAVEPSSAPVRVEVVMNWLAELQRSLPTR